MSDQSDMNNPDSASERLAGCRRCGVCCLKGGPCLHHEDQAIIDGGGIALTELFTIRHGEPAWDNINNRIFLAAEDIIKIRSRAGASACLFYNDADHSCAVYTSRPLECRVLKCWDIKDIIDVYDKRRLSRKDLLKNNKELLDLVSAHQEMCGYEKISGLVRGKNKETLAYLVRYDRAYRELVIEKGVLDAAVLDFLFGFPLAATIRRYGLSPGDIGVADE